MNSDKYKSYEYLFRLYWIEEKTTKEIANECNLKSSVTILNWMIKLNIPRRNGRFVEQNWDDLTLGGKHNRMRKIILKPEICLICKEKKKLELTNLNHEYNNNIEEWIWKCSSCHKKYDFETGLRSWSEEYRKKQSEIKKGKKFSEDHKKKLSKSSQKRWENEEERKNMSEKTKERFEDPKNHPMFGKHCLEEHKMKLSEKFKGKTLEELYGERRAKEMKEKMSKSQRKRQERKRGN